MRCTIKVVGLGKRRAGTSTKNGRDYDFIPMAFVMHDQQFEGVRAATANVSGPDVDAVGGLKVNQEIDAFYHFANNQIVIDGLLRSGGQ